ncbi:hypothetical protein, partial [Peribacillus frigoritolerans]|uniref:hypothetical protein n=1 Tax=Peribacillus frigoritolerans TaxID=450367 RepID=UPI003017B69F
GQGSRRHSLQSYNDPDKSNWTESRESGKGILSGIQSLQPSSGRILLLGLLPQPSLTKRTRTPFAAFSTSSSVIRLPILVVPIDVLFQINVFWAVCKDSMSCSYFAIPLLST